MVQTTTHDRRPVAPLGLVLEAGAEIAALGAIAITVYAMSAIRISDGGLILGLSVYLVIGVMILRGLRQHCPHSHFGLANAITLLRTVFSSFLYALSADILVGNYPLADSSLRWIITALAAASLALDGLDGWIARTHGMQSRFGAQFDMHADALFVLSLSLLLCVSGIAGPWVLLSGLMFYLFQVAGHLWPGLCRPLPPQWRRKAVCVIQTALLITALAPVTPFWIAQLACFTGLGLLTWSFGIDVAWLLRRENQ